MCIDRVSIVRNIQMILFIKVFGFLWELARTWCMTRCNFYNICSCVIIKRKENLIFMFWANKYILFPLKRHGYDFGQIYFSILIVYNVKKNAFLLNNKNLSISRRVISKTQSLLFFVEQTRFVPCLCLH